MHQVKFIPFEELPTHFLKAIRKLPHQPSLNHQPQYKAIKTSCLKHPAVCKVHFILLEFRSPGRDQLGYQAGWAAVPTHSLS